MDEIGAGGGGTESESYLNPSTNKRMMFLKTGGVVQCKFDAGVISSSNTAWTDALDGYAIDTKYRPILETAITQCLPMVKDSYGTFIWKVTTDGHIYYKYFGNGSSFWPTAGMSVILTWLVW